MTGGSATAEDVSRNPLRVIGTLALLLAFASISTDLYLPALPTMVTALHSSPGTMESTVTGCLIGFSLGPLFWGPIEDRSGRRMPVAIGIVLFVICSAGCAMGDSVSIRAPLRSTAWVVVSREDRRGRDPAELRSTALTVLPRRAMRSVRSNSPRGTR